jgi:hypothetical protein
MPAEKTTSNCQRGVLSMHPTRQSIGVLWILTYSYKSGMHDHSLYPRAKGEESGRRCQVKMQSKSHKNKYNWGYI